MKFYLIQYIKNKYNEDELLDELQHNPAFANEFLIDITNYISIYKENIKQIKANYKLNKSNSAFLKAEQPNPTNNASPSIKNHMKIDIETIIDFLSEEE
jgi:hypothetical protein